MRWRGALRIYPYPMVWPLPRPWSETMVSIPLWAQKTLETKGCLGLERPFSDLVSQTPRPRGRGRPLFAESGPRSPGKQAFARGHPWPDGADVHDPKGLPKTSVRKTLGCIVVPYVPTRRRPLWNRAKLYHVWAHDYKSEYECVQISLQVVDTTRRLFSTAGSFEWWRTTTS